MKFLMFDVSSTKEKLDVHKIELVDALESYSKIFSHPTRPESKLEDLSLDFHVLNDRTRDFIKLAIRHISELENMVEKDEKFKWKN